MTGKWEPIAEKDLKVGMMIGWGLWSEPGIDPMKVILIEPGIVHLDECPDWHQGWLFLGCNPTGFWQWIEEETK